MVVSYDEGGSSLNGGDYEKSWAMTGFDISGRNTGYTESGHATSSGPYQLERSDVGYNTYNGTNTVSSYHEAGNLAGTIFEKDWQANSYDDRLRLISYTETGFDSNRGAYQTTRDTTAYDLFSQLSTYTEHQTNAAGGVSIITRTQSGYDDKGHLDSFVQTTQDPAGSTTLTERLNTTYNEKSQVLEYNQTDTLTGFDTITQITNINWTATNADYTAEGINNANTTTRTITDGSVNSTFEVIKTTDWQGLEYNGQWQAVKIQDNTTTQGYNLPDEVAAQELSETQREAYLNSTDNAKFQVEALSVRSDIAYDQRGLLIEYNEVVSTQDLEEQSNIHWVAGSYNSNGLLLNYQQQIFNKIGDVVTSTNDLSRVDIVYDSSSRQSSFVETTKDDTVETVETFTNVIYDSVGRQYAYNKTTDSKTNAYEVQTHTQRNSTQYFDAFVCASDEVITSPADQSSVNVVVEGIVYSGVAQQLASITTTTKTASTTEDGFEIQDDLSSTALEELDGSDVETELNKKVVVVKTNCKYDSVNDLVAYTELTDDGTGVLTTINEKNAKYDSKHKKLGYEQEIKRYAEDASGQAVINNTYLSYRENVVYNDSNQIVSYEDITIVGADANKSEVSNIVYDEFNREFSKSSVNSRSDAFAGQDYDWVLMNEVQRTGTQYTNSGLAKSTDETMIDILADGNELRSNLVQRYQYDDTGDVSQKLTQSKLIQGVVGGIEVQRDDYLMTYILRDSYIYNECNQLVRYTDTTERVGDMSYSTAGTVDTSYDMSERQVAITVSTTTESIDGASSATTGETIKTYTNDGLLDTQEEVLITQSSDATQYSSNTQTNNSYVVYNNQPKIISSVTTGQYEYLNGTTGVVNAQQIDYSYDDNGKLIGASGYSSKTENKLFVDPDDGQEYFNNVQIDTSKDANGDYILDEYILINGQAKLIESKSTTTTSNADTSSTVGETTTYYSHDDNGIVIKGTESDGAEPNTYVHSGTYAKTLSTTNDGFGNISVSSNATVFKVINNKQKTEFVRTNTDANNIDGSSSNSQTLITYVYDEQTGLLKIGDFDDGITAGTTTSTSDDGFGNKSESTIELKYEILNNQAMVKESVNTTKRTDVDGTITDSVLTTVNQNNSDDNNVIDATVTGDQIVTDIFGSITNTSIEQYMQNFTGQNRLMSNVSTSTTDNVDGSTSESYSETTYNNNFNGTLNSANGYSDSTSDDGFGNTSKSHTEQVYEILANQAKVKISNTKTLNTSLDGTGGFSHTIATNDYGINSEGYQNVLIAASSNIDSYSYNFDTDPNYDLVTVESKYFDSILLVAENGTYEFNEIWSISKANQIHNFEIIAGKQRLNLVIVNSTKGYNPDGSFTVDSTGSTTYVNDIVTGLFESASGFSATIVDDGFGNISTTDAINSYAKKNGQARLETSVATTKTINQDGSTNDSTSNQSYSYDDNGLLLGQTGYSDGTYNDGYGNLNVSHTDQAYALINNKTKLESSVTESKTQNKDASFNETVSNVNYTYDSDSGVLLKVEGDTTLNEYTDGFGVATSLISGKQIYVIFKGQAKVVESRNTTSITDSTSKLNTTNTTITRNYYDNDSNSALTSYTVTVDDGFVLDLETEYLDSFEANGRLTDVWSMETVIGSDAQGNDFDSITNKDYFLQYGSAKQEHAKTIKTIDFGALGSKKVTDNWIADVNGYDSRGRVVAYEQTTREEGISGEIGNMDVTMSATWQSSGYDDQTGFSKGFVQSVTTTDNNTDYELTTTQQRSNVSYYLDGNFYGKEQAYDEVTTSSDAQGKINKNKVINIEYNELGQNNLKEQTVDVVDLDDELIYSTDITKSDIVYDEFGLVDKETSVAVNTNSQNLNTKTMVDYTYDNLARITKSIQEITQTDLSGQERIEVTDTTVKDNITYNVLGQQLTWHEEIESSATPTLVTTKDFIVTYDDLGRRSRVEEQGENKSEDESYLSKFTLIKDNMEFDDKANLLNYDETYIDDTRPGVTIASEVVLEYFNNSQLSDSKRNIHETAEYDDGISIDNTYSTQKIFTKDSYNDLGQVVFATDITINSDGVTITKVDNQPVVYKKTGQKSGSEKIVTEENLENGTVVYIDAESDIDYNDLGQVSAKSQTKTYLNSVTNQPLEAERVSDYIFSYDAQGRQDTVSLYVTENLGDTSAKSKTEINNIFKENTSLVETRKTKRYDVLGLDGYERLLSSTQVTNKSYDQRGIATEYLESDLDDSASAISWRNVTVIEFGQNSLEKRININYQNEDEEVFSSEIVSNTNYDYWGNPDSEVETFDSSGELLNTTLFESQYNALTSLLEVSTKRTSLDGVTSELINYYDDYDSYGNVISGKSESNIKSKDGLVKIDQGYVREYDDYKNVINSTDTNTDGNHVVVITSTSTFKNQRQRERGKGSELKKEYTSDGQLYKEETSINTFDKDTFDLVETNFEVLQMIDGAMTRVNVIDEESVDGTYTSNGEMINSKRINSVVVDGLEYVEKTEFLSKDAITVGGSVLSESSKVLLKGTNDEFKSSSVTNTLDMRGGTLQFIDTSICEDTVWSDFGTETIYTNGTTFTGDVFTRSLFVDANSGQTSKSSTLSFYDAYSNVVRNDSLSSNVAGTLLITNEHQQYDLQGNAHQTVTTVSVVEDDLATPHSQSIAKKKEFDLRGNALDVEKTIYGYDTLSQDFTIVGNTTNVIQEFLDNGSKKESRIIVTDNSGIKQTLTVIDYYDEEDEDGGYDQQGNSLSENEKTYGSFNDQTQEWEVLQTERVKDTIVYNVLSNQTSYIQTTELDTEAPLVDTVVYFGYNKDKERIGVEYDAKSKLLSFEQLLTRKDNDGSGKIDTWSAMTKQNMVYDVMGNLFSYNQQNVSSDSPDKTSITNRLQTTYDAFDNIETYISESYLEGSQEKSLTTRLWTDCDAQGRTVSYVNLVQNSKDDEVSETKRIYRESTTYNANGYIESYVQFIGSDLKGDNLDDFDQQGKPVYAGKLNKISADKTEYNLYGQKVAGEEVSGYMYVGGYVVWKNQIITEYLDYADSSHLNFLLETEKFAVSAPEGEILLNTDSEGNHYYVFDAETLGVEGAFVDKELVLVEVGSQAYLADADDLNNRVEVALDIRTIPAAAIDEYYVTFVDPENVKFYYTKTTEKLVLSGVELIDGSSVELPEQVYSNGQGNFGWSMFQGELVKSLKDTDIEMRIDCSDDLLARLGTSTGTWLEFNSDTKSDLNSEENFVVNTKVFMYEYVAGDPLPPEWIETTTTLSGIEYNSNEQKVYAKKEIIESSAPDTVRIEYFGAYVDETGVLYKVLPTYNSEGTLDSFSKFSSEEDVVSNAPVANEPASNAPEALEGDNITRLFTDYDAEGRVLAYEETYVNQAKPYQVSTTEYSNMTYNENGLLETYVLTTTNEGTEHTVYTNEQINVLDEISVSELLLNKDFSDDTIDGDFDTLTLANVTDKAGYKWVYVETDGIDPIDRKEQWGQIYNPSGSEVTYRDVNADGLADIVVDIAGEFTVYLNTGMSFYKPDQIAYKEISETKRVETKYDEFDRKNYSIEVIRKIDDLGNTLGIVTTRTFGVAPTFNDATSTWTAEVSSKPVVYDQQDRLKEFSETIVKTAANGDENISYQHKYNVEYNNDGTEKSYSQDSRSPGGHYSSFDRSDIFYDDDGRLFSYVDSNGTKSDSVKVDQTYSVTRLATFYDEYGRVVSFVEKGNKYFAGKVKTNRDYKEAVSKDYDEYGRKESVIMYGGYEFINENVIFERKVVSESGTFRYSRMYDSVSGYADGNHSDNGNFRIVDVAYMNESDHKDHTWCTVNYHEHEGPSYIKSTWSFSSGYYISKLSDTTKGWMILGDVDYHAAWSGDSQKIQKTALFVNRYSSASGFTYNSGGYLDSTVNNNADGTTTVNDFNQLGDNIGNVTTGLDENGKAFESVTTNEYYFSGRLKSSTSVRNGLTDTNQSLVQKTVANYEIGGGRTVNTRTHVGKGVRVGEGYIRDETTVTDKHNVETDYFGTMKQWGLIASGGDYYIEKKLSKENGVIKEETIREDYNIPKPKKSIWKIIVCVIIAIIAIVVTILSLGSLGSIAWGFTAACFGALLAAAAICAVIAVVASIATQLVMTGSVDWNEVGKAAIKGAITGVFAGIFKAIDVLQKIADMLKTVTDILGVIGQIIQSVVQAFVDFWAAVQKFANGFKSVIREIILAVVQVAVSMLAEALEKISGVKYLGAVIGAFSAAGQSGANPKSIPNKGFASYAIGLLAKTDDEGYGAAAAKGAQIGSKLREFQQNADKSADLSKADKDAEYSKDYWSYAMQSGIESSEIKQAIIEIFDIKNEIARDLISNASFGNIVGGAVNDAKKALFRREYKRIDKSLEEGTTIDDVEKSNKKPLSTLEKALYFKDKNKLAASEGKNSLAQGYKLNQTKYETISIAEGLLGKKLDPNSFSFSEKGTTMSLNVGQLSDKTKNQLTAMGMQLRDDRNVDFNIVGNNAMLSFMDASAQELSSSLGDSLNNGMEDIINVDGISSFMEGSAKLDFMLNRAGSIFDVQAKFTMSIGGVKDKTLLGLANSSGSSTVDVTFTKSTMTGLAEVSLANTNAGQMISGLKDRGLDQTAEQVEGLVAYNLNMIDIDSVNEMTVAVKLDKVKGKTVVGSVKQVVYRAKVAALRSDRYETKIAESVKAEDIELTAIDIDGVVSSRISEMKVDVNSLTPDTLSLVMDYDSNMGKMLTSFSKNISTQLLDKSKIELSVGTKITSKGLMYTQMTVSLNYNNLKQGSLLSSQLSLTKADIDGNIMFTMSSQNPGVIMQQKVEGNDEQDAVKALKSDGTDVVLPNIPQTPIQGPGLPGQSSGVLPMQHMNGPITPVSPVLRYHVPNNEFNAGLAIKPTMGIKPSFIRPQLGNMIQGPQRKSSMIVNAFLAVKALLSAPFVALKNTYKSIAFKIANKGAKDIKVNYFKAEVVIDGKVLSIDNVSKGTLVAKDGERFHYDVSLGIKSLESIYADHFQFSNMSKYDIQLEALKMFDTGQEGLMPYCKSLNALIQQAYLDVGVILGDEDFLSARIALNGMNGDFNALKSTTNVISNYFTVRRVNGMLLSSAAALVSTDNSLAGSAVSLFFELKNSIIEAKKYVPNGIGSYLSNIETSAQKQMTLTLSGVTDILLEKSKSFDKMADIYGDTAIKVKAWAIVSSSVVVGVALAPLMAKSVLIGGVKLTGSQIAGLVGVVGMPMGMYGLANNFTGHKTGLYVDDKFDLVKLNDFQRKSKGADALVGGGMLALGFLGAGIKAYSDVSKLAAFNSGIKNSSLFFDYQVKIDSTGTKYVGLILKNKLGGVINEFSRVDSGKILAGIRNASQGVSARNTNASGNLLRQIYLRNRVGQETISAFGGVLQSERSVSTGLLPATVQATIPTQKNIGENVQGFAGFIESSRQGISARTAGISARTAGISARTAGISARTAGISARTAGISIKSTGIGFERGAIERVGGVLSSISDGSAVVEAGQSIYKGSNSLIDRARTKTSSSPTTVNRISSQARNTPNSGQGRLVNGVNRIKSESKSSTVVKDEALPKVYEFGNN